MSSTARMVCLFLAMGVLGSGCSSTQGDGCYQDKARDYARFSASDGGNTDSPGFGVRIELARTGWIQTWIIGDFPDQGFNPPRIATVCPSAGDAMGGRIFIKGYEGDYRKLR